MAVPSTHDADAASIFLDRSSEGRPYLDGLALVEIETDNDLLSLLTEAPQADIREVAASAVQTTVRMLYVVDLIDMLSERITET